MNPKFVDKISILIDKIFIAMILNQLWNHQKYSKYLNISLTKRLGSDEQTVVESRFVSPFVHSKVFRRIIHDYSGSHN